MANFPSSVSTNSNLYIAVNGIQTTLAASILATDTTIQLTSTTGFPTTGYATIDNSEVISYTGISGANLTGCTRGADGTTAAPHSLGVTVGATIVAAHHNLLKDEVIAIETALGAGYTQSSSNTANAVVQRDGSGNFSAGTITAALNGNATTATTATKATNLAGGAAGAIPYQSAVDTTGFSGVGSAGDVVLSGGTGAPTFTTPTAAPTTSTIMKRDSNANVRVNTLIENFTTTVTSGGTTPLTASTSPLQQFTGTTTQIVTLPDCTTLNVGYQITVLNRSTGTVTVNNNGGSLQQAISAGAQSVFTCTNTGSVNGTWDVSASAGTGTVTSVNGTTNQITSTNPTTTPVLAIANPLTLPGPMTAGGNIAMASNKVTGMAAGTANGDAIRYEQLIPTFSSYRRPTLVYSSGTVVTVETGISDGTSGDAVVLFPDGNLRTETSSSRYNMTISQNAVFNNATLGNNQGGLRTGTVANNTWYACYAVKVTTFSANWVLVADTVLPTVSNYATLNSNFGTNGWVYLGMVRYGDQSGTANAILFFTQVGHKTSFLNTCTGNAETGRGIRMATTAGATGLTYAYTLGTSGTAVPDNISSDNLWQAALNPGTSPNAQVFENNASGYQIVNSNTGGVGWTEPFCYSFLNASPSTIFLRASNSESTSKDFFLIGFSDTALGVGSNPLL